MARTLLCLRYFLVGGAIVIGISGVAVGACMSYFIYQLHEYPPLTPDDVCDSSAVLLAMGLITCLVGWCAWQFLDFTNKAQVIIFAVLLGIISIVETSAGAWALIKHEQIDTLPVAHLEQIFAFATEDDKPLWDRMQSKLHCCGVDGPNDYRGQKSIPWSCCDTSIILDESNVKAACSTIYARGCQHVVLNRTRSILLRVFLVALGSVLLQVFFILCICCYTRAYNAQLKRRREAMAARRASMPTKESDTMDNLLPPVPKY